MSGAEVRSEPIAIVGLACRFPGAADLEAYGRNLRAGVESIRRFTADELRAAGVPEDLLSRPDYVRAGGVLGGAERFDAAFFGFSPRDAELIDPQQRLFLECAWTAMEHAGFDPASVPGATGVFAGAGMNTYLLRQIAPNPAVIRSAGEFAVMIANDKDHLAPRVAYKLGLRGPAVTVQTACSTSLVAVHAAVQSLLSGECDSAIAGGVSVRFPQVAGYPYQEGMILSADGHCRAFDARASGTVGGSGVGAVVLRRLADAQADGQTVHAVILGSAVNNDGAAKVGYTAPSPEGQAAVVSEALAVAGVGAETIGYVEAHGTGTRLGDPIEVAALTAAYRRQTGRRQYCGLGSVKTNLGHLDAAAGIAGLIKTVLALRAGEIPPSLHFSEPNPDIDFAASPFRVVSRLESWPVGPAPRRAGVSSFGIGGTNAHVILEEAPPVPPSRRQPAWRLLAFSARSESALGRMGQELADWLDGTADDLGDIAYTLAMGRREFVRRRFVVARTAREAAAALRGSSGTALEPEGQRLETVGRAWAAGQTLDRAALFSGEGWKRVPLPTYPFEGEVCWIETDREAGRGLDEWFYLPGWALGPSAPPAAAVCDGSWLVVGGASARAMAGRLRSLGAAAAVAPRGDAAAAALAGLRPRWIVHLAGLANEGGDALGDLWSLIEALGRAELAPGARLIVAASGLCALPGEAPPAPEGSLLLGPVRSLPREIAGLSARAVDLPGAPDSDAAADGLLAEARREGAEVLVALRGRERWLPETAPARLGPPRLKLREQGVVLITGGLGGVGGVIARHLVRDGRARLVLTGRTALPERSLWAGLLAGPGLPEPIAARLRLIQELESAGGEVLAGCADAADEAAMRQIVAAARARWGAVHGVIHAAGLPGAGALLRRSAAEAAAVLAPKVAGARVLERIFRGQPLDFFVLMSSLSARLGEFGQADYASANAFLEAQAQVLHAEGWPAVAILWDAWRDSGMAARPRGPSGWAEWAASRRPWQLTDEQGVEVFRRAIEAGVSRVIVSTQDFATRLAEAGAPAALARAATAHAATQRRPLDTPCVAPATATERRLAACWEELIGVAPVGAEDDFFDLGGHSLLATQVLARIHEGWGVTLGMAAFFAAPTVAALARRVDAAEADLAGPELRAAPRTGPLPLSFQQRALWLLDRMEGSSAHFNELGAHTIRGPLDVGRLKRSLAAVVRRHEVLRTRIVESDGEPVQEVLPERPVEWEESNLAAGPPEDVAAGLVARPFDLARDPLVRATLIRVDREEHVLLVVVHHIVFDGWSSALFFREMVAHYAAETRGAAPDVPPLAVQYADYAVWQRSALAPEAREPLAAYWRSRLKGPLPVLALPADRPRPVRPGYRGRKHPVRIAGAVKDRIEGEARLRGASPFMVLLAAYAALLGRYAGQDEVIVGCPSAGRTHRALEPLAGFFVNPLPIRIGLRGNPGLAALVERTREAVLSAQEHQALPFELIVDAARPPRDPARHAVFQTQFIYQGMAPLAPSAPGLEIAPLDWPDGPARTDLDLYLWETAGELGGYFIFDVALFDAATIARLAERWLRLLELATENSASALADLRLDRAVPLPQIRRSAPSSAP